MHLNWKWFQIAVRSTRARTAVVYPRRKNFLCQNQKIHPSLGSDAKGMWWFSGCLTPVWIPQSWHVWAERSRKGLRSTKKTVSCSSGMRDIKILNNMPKATCHALFGHSTDWPQNSASFSLRSASRVALPILRLLTTWILEDLGASGMPNSSYIAQTP